MKGLFSALAVVFCAAAPAALAAQHHHQSGARPGQTVDLLFIDTPAQPLSAQVQQHVPGGQTTYLVNCQSRSASDCTVHDATITVVQNATYDYHTGVNSAGSLTIHCVMEGGTPVSCTKTVAGGPTGYRITTSKPKRDNWAYLPVKITKQPQMHGAYTGMGAPATSYPASWSATPTAGPTRALKHGNNAIVSSSPSPSSGPSSGSAGGANPAGSLGSCVTALFVTLGLSVFGLFL